MAERVTKSVKWSEAEWGAVVGAAGRAGVAPATWVRAVALRAADWLVPAAPEERESLVGRGAAGDGGLARGDLPAASSRLAVDPALPDGVVEARGPGGKVLGRVVGVAGGPAGPDLMAELKASFDRRPVGSAGSGGPASPPSVGSPPSGVGASSAPAPGGAGSLLDAVVQLLTQRFGARADHRAAASRLIADGRVTVYGDVVRMPGAPIAEGDDVRIA